MFQPVEHTAILTTIWRYDVSSRDLVNSVYFERGAGWDDTSIGLLLAAASGNYATSFDTIVPDDAGLVQIIARDLEEEFAVSQTYDTPNAGAEAANFAPPSVTAWVKMKGTSGFPPRDGGVFFPFVRETYISDVGIIDNDWRGFVDDAWNAYIDALKLAAGGCTHVLVSRYSKTAVPLFPHKRTAGVTSPVTSLATRALCGSQRDRRG